MEVKLMNMCMIYNEKGEVLIQDRKKENWGGCAFPGGKVEIGESIIESTIREVKEETGLAIKNLEGCGYKDWEKDGIRRVVFLFKTKDYEGELIENHREGRNFWVNTKKIKDLNVAERFLDNLPMFMENKYTEMYLEKDEKNDWKSIIQ